MNWGGETDDGCTELEEGRTMKVRIAVAIASCGRWSAYAGDQLGDAENKSWAEEDLVNADVGDNITTHFVEAEVPVPVGMTIQGSVKEEG